MTVIGIDPGKKGGIAVLRDGELESVYPWDSDTLILTLAHQKPALVTVEKVHAMPNQGVTSMFHFGQSFGEIIGICNAMNYYEGWENLMLVPPQTWKRACGLIGGSKSDSIRLAMELYPETDFKATRRARGPADGLCEAALIARYGYQKALAMQAEEDKLPF